MSKNVHVHLSDKYQVNYNHLLTWFLPQLKTRDNNVLNTLDPGIGTVTNDVTTIGQDSKLVLTNSSYNVVIVLDMSASMFTVDMDHKKVIIEELDKALKLCITPLCKPDIHPWSDQPDTDLDVNITVLAYTPQFKTRFFSVLIQGYPLTSKNSDQLLNILVKRCSQMHDFIKSRSDLSSWSYTDSNNHRHGLCTLIREVLNILQIQKSPPLHGEAGDSQYNNTKNVMIMITDGVIGETHHSRDIVQILHARTTSCSFVRVGACAPAHYGFGYIPNISLLKFIAKASGGLYWDWGQINKIRIESVLQWSPFCGTLDHKGLILRKLPDEPPLTQASLISIITRKITEGFKLSEIEIKSQGLAPDFSGTELTTLHITMSLMWRKRIHVTYELSTDLPIEQYSVQKKVKTTVYVYADHVIINDKHNTTHLTRVKLLHQFNQFVSGLRPHQDDANERRWIFDLHNYAASSLNNLKFDPSQHKNQEPYKIERIPTVANNSDQDMNRFDRFWRRLLSEQDDINANFDVYRLKCWLQFDLTLPKCLTGTSRHRNPNKEFQIYSRSHGFLQDVLVKWSSIVIEKDIYIQLYKIKDSKETQPKNSFVWAAVNRDRHSSASMSVYIAMHRDIPFTEQHAIKQDLVSRLLSVKFQGTQLLDSNIKVGLDTTLKKRGGSFLPFKLKTEYACQQIPKNVDKIIMWNNSPKRGELYLHKLVCNWKTCPNVDCCSDDLIKELRNEIFNALFRLRLQEDYRPVNVSGKVFSCFTMVKMKAVTLSRKDVTLQKEERVASPDDEEDDKKDKDITCLLQYVITVDDEATERTKDQRKISSKFTTEILIEPQWGIANCKEGSLSYLDKLKFTRIPPKIFDLDFKLISSLCTFATIKKICSQLDKGQPEFSDQFCPKPTSFKEPISTPDLPYLFLVSNLLSKSLVNVINLPLLSMPKRTNKEASPEETDEPCDMIPESGFVHVASPNTQLLHTLSELLELSNKRDIDLSLDEVKLIQNNVTSRIPVGEYVKFNENIPESAWKCYVRFHTIEEKEDKTRLQFTLLPVPPDHFTEEQIEEWFPDGTVNVFVFDCFYKLLLGTFTNSKRCSLEKLNSCDKYLDNTEYLDQLECPALISQILEENTVSHSGLNLDNALKFKYVAEIGRRYEKSYILGVYHALQHGISLEQICVDKALELIDKPSLMDHTHVKKETKHFSLSKYLGAVCSHVSGQQTCCHLEHDNLDYSIESSDRDATSESYNADVEMTLDSKLIEDDTSSSLNMFTAADNMTGDNITGDISSDDGSYLSTPLQNDSQWTRVISSLPLGSTATDIYSGEIIISASSAELTPVLSDRRFEDSITVSSHYNESNVDIDDDSGSSAGSNLEPSIVVDVIPQHHTGTIQLGETPVDLEPWPIEQPQGAEQRAAEHIAVERGAGEPLLIEQPQGAEQRAPQHGAVERGTGEKGARVLSNEQEINMPEHPPMSAQFDGLPCGLDEKKVSFADNTASHLEYPLINIISSTPVIDGPNGIATERHESIKAKFNEIIDTRLVRISQYSDQFLILKPDPIELDSFSLDRHQTVLFMKMSCKHMQSSESKVMRTLPTCVLNIVDDTEKKKRDIELWFTCYTLPAVTPPSPVYRSPTHSFINSRVPHRRKDSYKKSEHAGKSGEKKDKFQGSSVGSGGSISAHQIRTPHYDDTDDGIPAIYTSSKSYSRQPRCRDSIAAPSSSTSSPLLTRQNNISDPISRKNILDDMYQDIQWLIDDQHITHLRRKSPVTLDVLRQVLEHCRCAPPSTQNSIMHEENLSYVDSWIAKEDKLRHEEKVRHELRQEEKLRHEELLAKIVLSPEFESFSLCRINNFFYYTLIEENEQKQELSGRDALSAHSSISSIGSRPSQYRSSSSSAPDEIPSHTAECLMKPCSKYWIVIQVNYNDFQVAFHTADRGEGSDTQIDHAVLNKIVSRISHLNKMQNQEFLLHQIVDKKICPEELLYNPAVLSHGGDVSLNKYVCDVVHTIEVQLWDKNEHDGLKDIRESLFNLKCDNADKFVYYYHQEIKSDIRSTFYFQLPEPNPQSGVKSKKLQIEVRGLEPPDPTEQSNMDMFVQQKLEETKLVDIARRLNRNSQAKLTVEEVTFLSNKNNMSHRTLYCKIPPYITNFLPHFWFYLDQHLVQQELFSPRYYENNTERIQFRNESTEALETTRDHEVYIKLKTGNLRSGYFDNTVPGVRYPGRGRLTQFEFQSLLLVNVTIVDQRNQHINYNKRYFSRRSPLFTEMQDGYEPPSAKPNKDIQFTSKIDESSKMSLKLRIIEKRKKAGSSSNIIKEFETCLLYAVHAAYISLLLEVYILPAELYLPIRPKTSAIVDVNESDDMTTTRPLSSSVGKSSILSKMKGRRSSNESLDSITDYKEKLRRKVAPQLSKDDNCSLHPCLREPCLEACKVGHQMKLGQQMKTRIVEHYFMDISSVFVSDQVINKIIDGLFPKFFKVRIFSQDQDYKMLPPTVAAHTEQEIENTVIVLVARQLGVWNDSRIKLEGQDMNIKCDDKPIMETFLEMEHGVIDVNTDQKLQVPRQMHIIATLDCKKLNFWFYNVHKLVQNPFIASMKALTSWLSTRGMLLTRVLLYKARHEFPSHYSQSELLPESQEELELFLEQSEPPSTPTSDQSQQQRTFKNNEIDRYYNTLYEDYHPGLVSVDEASAVSRDPLKRHGTQLGVYMNSFEQKKEADLDEVDLDDPDLPTHITREQAKLLKKNARLLHYIASPLLFSSKLKSSQTDKETFLYLGNSTSDAAPEEPAWFLHFKNQLFEKFITYLTDPMRGIRMTLKYLPRGMNKEVDVTNTLSDDDNEALLCKDTPGGGRILLGVLIQNSTFCVKLYGFDSDNPLKLFQECSNLKTQTHTNSFNYDWMVHAIYDSLKAHRDGTRVNQILPIHHCICSVVKHYETVAEPPHTSCWIKRYSELEYTSQARNEYSNISPEGLQEYIVQNQESLGVYTVDSEGPGAKKDETKLIVKVLQDKIVNYHFAVILSQISITSAWKFRLTYYVILANQFTNSPPSTLLKEPSASYFRSRNESMTTISTASTSPSSLCDDSQLTSRPRINSQLFNVHEAERKQELYRDAKQLAEEELKLLLQCSQRNHHRDTLIQKLLRPPSTKATISLDLSYHSFLKDDFTYDNLRELEGELSFNKNLLEKRSHIYKLLQNWSYARYKNLLDFLKGKIDLVTITDSKSKEDKSVIGIATKRTQVGKREKISVVVIKFTEKYLDIFSILKNQDEVHDSDHVEFWERLLSLICVFVWERLLS